MKFDEKIFNNKMVKSTKQKRIGNAMREQNWIKQKYKLPSKTKFDLIKESNIREVSCILETCTIEQVVSSSSNINDDNNITK